MPDLKDEEDTAGTGTPEVDSDGSVDELEGSTDDTEDEGEVFSAEYVKTLRDENAAARVKAKRSDELEAALRTAVIASATSKILVDPEDLPWSDDLADAEGMPNPELIREAATALVEKRPHLGRIQGSAGQGYRGESSDAVDLAGLLRMSA